MEKKKYVLKSSILESAKVSADGTENSEHIFDMIERAELCFGNIQDNVDLCMDIFKLNKDNIQDEDEIDALQLMCEDCITIENEATSVIESIEIIKGKIEKHLKVKEYEVEEFLKAILLLELKSKDIVDKILRR